MTSKRCGHLYWCACEKHEWDADARGSIYVPIDKARALMDIAISSMDFGSGFLDDNEVAILREFAVTLGMDPMLATPEGFRGRYKHAFKEDSHDKHWVYPPDKKDWLKAKLVDGPEPDHCDWCEKSEADEVHQP